MGKIFRDKANVFCLLGVIAGLVMVVVGIKMMFFFADKSLSIKKYSWMAFFAVVSLVGVLVIFFSYRIRWMYGLSRLLKIQNNRLEKLERLLETMNGINENQLDKPVSD